MERSRKRHESECNFEYSVLIPSYHQQNQEVLDVDKYFSMDILHMDIDIDLSDLSRNLEPLLKTISKGRGHRWIHRSTHTPTDTEGFPFVSFF